MKRILLALLVFSVTLGLAACAKEEVPEGRIEIEYWHHMEGSSLLALESAVDEFNKTVGFEKGIWVTPSFQGWNTTSKLQTLAAANDFETFPDVVQLASFGVPIIADYDLTVPVEEMYDLGENILYNRDDILANAARTFTFKNQQIGMPFSNSAILLYINEDAWAEAGLTAGDYPTTIAELATATEALTVKDGDTVTQYGLEVKVKRYPLVNWIGGMGEYNFIGDNEGGRSDYITKYTIGEDGSLMTFMNEWEKVINTGGYKADEDNINEEFAMGTSAMVIMSSARIGKVEALEPTINWTTAPFPSVLSSDTGGVAVGGSSNVMFDHDDEERLQAAWIFTQYMSGVEAQNIFCSISGYIPINWEVYETDEWKSFVAENPAFEAAVESLTTSHVNVQEPFDMVMFEIHGMIGTEMTLWGQGEQSKQDTHDNIVSKANAFIQEYADANYE